MEMIPIDEELAHNRIASAHLLRLLRGEDGEYNSLPYLFVGSGISRRYLDLPDWQGLLRHFSDQIGLDFDYQLASVDGHLPSAASSIAEEFHARWWKDPRYASEVEMHRGEVKNPRGALKVSVAAFVSELDKLTSEAPGIAEPELLSEVEALRNIVIDGVITTNYDSLMEQLFPSFDRYIGQDGLLLSDAQFIAEIYKIHGCASAPQSIVLTQEDYAAFEGRNAYLAAKLLTIFAEHPVIFAGYSLGDKYLGEILENIARAVGPDRIEELGSRILFLEWNKDPSSTPSIGPSVIQRDALRLPVTRISTHSFRWVWDVLGQLERPFPSKVLRELSKHVKNLISHPDPGQEVETVRAIPIDGDEGSDYKVVFGVGAFSDTDLQELSMLSARSMQTEDLLEDVLGIRERPLAADNVLMYGIPEHIRPSRKQFVPVHKYLHESGRIDTSGDIDFSGLPNIIQNLAVLEPAPAENYRGRFEREFKGQKKSLTELMESDEKLYFKLQCLLMVDESEIDLEELRSVLVSIAKEGHPELESSGNLSNFRKAVCRYDRMKVQRILSQ